MLSGNVAGKVPGNPSAAWAGKNNENGSAKQVVLEEELEAKVDEESSGASGASKSKSSSGWAAGIAEACVAEN